MDCMHLTGIRCYGYTGALPEEQVLGQWFGVDLTLWVDLATSGQTDQLSDTLDYRQVIQRVEARIANDKYQLLERLATVIVEDLLELECLERVKIRLAKLAVPIPNFTGQVAVEIQRHRAIPLKPNRFLGDD
jgi:7,8-dihydroneopterin aldolase/epimerase/oxygenase